MHPRYDAANAPAAISRDARLARRDQRGLGRRRALARRDTGHRPNRPDVSGPVPGLRRRISAAAVLVVPAIERPQSCALGWDEVSRI